MHCDEPTKEVVTPAWAVELLKRLDVIERNLSKVGQDEPAAEHLKSRVVMRRLGFSSHAHFWAFVHRQGVPHIRLNARNIVFPRAALEHWESKRTIGRVIH